ncbi:MAG: peptidoglycan-binding protein [Candidatus Paceibacterota bacterium]|jgi:peptidoglycan hydrolase-like protein with peptidoglycan-binding domain
MKNIRMSFLVLSVLFGIGYVFTPIANAQSVDILGCANGNIFNTQTGLLCNNNQISGTPSSYDFGTVTLRNGSRGEAVKELQRFLNDKEGLGLVIDGKLGPKTIAVIKKWQADHGLVADGLVGKMTKAEMNNEALALSTNNSLSNTNANANNTNTNNNNVINPLPNPIPIVTVDTTAIPVGTGINATPNLVSIWDRPLDHVYDYNGDRNYDITKDRGYSTVTFKGDITLSSAVSGGFFEVSSIKLVAPSGDAGTCLATNFSTSFNGQKVDPKYSGGLVPSQKVTSLKCYFDFNQIVRASSTGINGNSIFSLDLVVQNVTAGINTRIPKAVTAQAFSVSHVKSICSGTDTKFLTAGGGGMFGGAPRDPYADECYLNSDAPNRIAVYAFGANEIKKVTINDLPCTNFAVHNSASSSNSSVLLCDAPAIPKGSKIIIAAETTSGYKSSATYLEEAITSMHSNAYLNVVGSYVEYAASWAKIALDPTKKTLTDLALKSGTADINATTWNAFSRSLSGSYVDAGTVYSEITGSKIQPGARVYYVMRSGPLLMYYPEQKDGVAGLTRLGSVMGQKLSDGSFRLPDLERDIAIAANNHHERTVVTGDITDKINTIDGIVFNPDGSYGVVKDVYRLHYVYKCSAASCSPVEDAVSGTTLPSNTIGITTPKAGSSVYRDQLTLITRGTGAQPANGRLDIYLDGTLIHSIPEGVSFANGSFGNMNTATLTPGSHTVKVNWLDLDLTGDKVVATDSVSFVKKTLDELKAAVSFTIKPTTNFSSPFFYRWCDGSGWNFNEPVYLMPTQDTINVQFNDANVETGLSITAQINNKDLGSALVSTEPVKLVTYPTVIGKSSGILGKINLIIVDSSGRTIMDASGSSPYVVTQITPTDWDQAGISTDSCGPVSYSTNPPTPYLNSSGNACFITPAKEIELFSSTKTPQQFCATI